MSSSIQGPPPGAVKPWLHTLATAGVPDPRPDAELLRAYVDQRDGPAFLELLRRHGPLVLAVCRRLLQDPHDAEDAFQATFLVLVRKAGSLARAELLANWLYGVAHRTAMQVRKTNRRRRPQQPGAIEHVPSPGAGPAESAAERELCQVLDEEVRRLPGKYRTAVILCYLQGQSYAEAARQLGCPPGTLASWLARARDRLRARLGRRGLAVPAALIGFILAGEARAAAVAPGLAQGTLAGAGALLAGQTGAIPPKVLALYQGVLRVMLRTKLRFVAALLLALAAAGGLTLHLYGSAPAGPSPGQQTTPPQKSPATADQGKRDLVAPLPGGGESSQKDLIPEHGAVRQAKHFSIIVLNGVGRVTVRQTGKESVRVKGPKNAVPLVRARVEKDMLILFGPGAAPGTGGLNPFPGVGAINPLPRLEADNPLAGADKTPGVEFVVEAKNLRGLILNGVGYMQADRVKTKTLAVKLTGVGNIKVAGSADVLQVTLAGVGSFLGKALKAQRVAVRHGGLGKAVVNARRQLDVNLVGNGSVEYVGSPQLRQSILGLGGVRRVK
jgi:RNA polymerase sigma factor (sigma-70 family)